MILHKLKKRNDLKNKLEYPLKIKEHELTLSFKKKKKECKPKIKSLINETFHEIKKSHHTNIHLNEYLSHISDKIYNRNLHPKEKNVLEMFATNYSLVRGYQEIRKNLLLNDKDMLEEKAADIMKKEEERENKQLEFVYDEAQYNFDAYHQYRDDFNETKKKMRKPMDDFEKFRNENRYLRMELEIIKDFHNKLKDIYKAEKKKYEKHIKRKAHEDEEEGWEEIKNLGKEEKEEKEEKKKIEIKKDNSNNIENFNKNIKRRIKNNFLKSRNISIRNYYDIFNCNYYNNNNCNKYKKDIYSSLNHFSKDLSTQNSNNVKSNTHTIDMIYYNNKQKVRKKTAKLKKFALKQNFSLTNTLEKKPITHNTFSSLQSKSSKSIFKNTNTNTKSKKRKSRIFSSFYNSPKNLKKSLNIIDFNNEDFDKKDYLKKIIDFLKENIDIKRDNINILNKLVSDELKTYIYVKYFITKLIQDFRNDIQETNDNIKAKKDDEELKENEKLLFFCTYFYDNCLYGYNNIKCLLNDNKSHKSIKKQNKTFVTQNK